MSRKVWLLLFLFDLILLITILFVGTAGQFFLMLPVIALQAVMARAIGGPIKNPMVEQIRQARQQEVEDYTVTWEGALDRMKPEVRALFDKTFAQGGIVTRPPHLTIVGDMLGAGTRYYDRQHRPIDRTTYYAQPVEYGTTYRRRPHP